LKRNTIDGHLLHLIEAKGIRVSDEKERKKKMSYRKWERNRIQACGETTFFFSIFKEGRHFWLIPH